MDFTIITPSLNQGKYLADCLASVARQKGVTTEHYAIDGISTDDSSEVAAGFQHAIWISEKDSGMSEAINKGFDRAPGDWIMWLTADDSLQPYALSEILPILKSTAADVVYGDIHFIDKEGETIRRELRAMGNVRPCPSRLLCPVHRRILQPHEGHCGKFPPQGGFPLCDGRRVLREARRGGEDFPSRPPSCRVLPPPRGKRIPAPPRQNKRHGRRARRRAPAHRVPRDPPIYGFTLFSDPYLNGLADGCLWIAAAFWKKIPKAREHLLP